MSKSKALTEWFSGLTNKYIQFVKESKSNRCKLVGCETDPNMRQIKLHVMISGIKNQIVKFTPQELVTNDDMLHEFSQTDVRAITFYAFQQDKTQDHSLTATFSITGQEFSNGKTIFIIKKQNEESEYRKSAHELYCDTELLAKFAFNDLLVILSAAVQEQTIEDLEEMYK